MKIKSIYLTGKNFKINLKSFMKKKKFNNENFKKIKIHF